MTVHSPRSRRSRYSAASRRSVRLMRGPDSKRWPGKGSQDYDVLLNLPVRRFVGGLFGFWARNGCLLWTKKEGPAKVANNLSSSCCRRFLGMKWVLCCEGKSLLMAGRESRLRDSPWQLVWRDDVYPRGKACNSCILPFETLTSPPSCDPFPSSISPLFNIQPSTHTFIIHLCQG